MQKPGAICDTRTNRGRHRQAAREGLSAIWEHGFGTTDIDVEHKRGEKRRNNSTTDAAAHKFLWSIQSTARSYGGVGHHRRSTTRLAYLLWASLSVNSTNPTRNPSASEEKNHGGSTQKHNWRSNSARNSQAAEARATSTPVGVASNPKFRQIRHHLPANEMTLETTEEKDQFMGPDMERIEKLSIQEKMLILWSLTTLTIDIQNVLQSWMEFQHQLAVTAEAIVEVCVQKRPTIRLHNPWRPNTKHWLLDRQGNFCTSLFL